MSFAIIKSYQVLSLSVVLSQMRKDLSQPLENLISDITIYIILIKYEV